MSSDMPELKPCPFCGGDNLEVAHTQHWWVVCEGCGAEGQTWRTRRHAVRLWNTRADLATTAQTVGEFIPWSKEDELLKTPPPSVTPDIDKLACIKWNEVIGDSLHRRSVEDVKNLAKVRVYVQSQATMWGAAHYTVRGIHTKKNAPTSDDISYLKYHEDQEREARESLSLLDSMGVK